MNLINILGIANAKTFKPVKYEAGTPRERFVKNAKAQVEVLTSGADAKHTWFQPHGNGFKVSLRNGFKNLVLDDAGSTAVVVDTKEEVAAFLNGAIQTAESGALDEILNATAPTVGKKKVA